MVNQIDPVQIFLHIKKLNSDYRKMIKKVNDDSGKEFPDIEVHCQSCYSEELFPESKDYGSLKCTDCKLVFDIPYFFDQAINRWYLKSKYP